MGEEKATNSDVEDKRSAFYRWRLKWMPFANLTVLGIAIYGLLQLPNVEVSIIEPLTSASVSESSSAPMVPTPFTLRVNIDKTLGCDFKPSSIKAIATSEDGSVIELDGSAKNDREWVAKNVSLPLGEYRLEASVDADCGEPEIVSDSIKMNVVCIPLTAEKARVKGDACGEYVADSCGGYVKLDSCADYGANDPRITNEKLSCSQSGYYVGKSVSEYVTDDGAGHYFTALKCGSENNKDCYELPSTPGACKYSKSPEEFGFYGSKDDSSFHKCRIECG